MCCVTWVADMVHSSWIALSSGVIIFNKWILHTAGFGMPLTTILRWCINLLTRHSIRIPYVIPRAYQMTID